MRIAAQNGHLDIVRFLVEVDSSKDQADNDGATALLLAAQYGHVDIVRFLLGYCAENDATPLLGTTQNGHFHCESPLVFLRMF
jgi:ankyrin repeat protein